MTESESIKEVILGYRKLIKARYQYAALKALHELPTSFDERRISLFRNYFLAYIYPPIEKREELNEAFESLDNYIKQPEKLLSLLLESTRLIFRYGRHLPKILFAGLKALRSFRTATAFEKKLANAAIDAGLEPQLDEVKIEALITTLPRDEINAFIESSEALFETLHDRELVRKVEEIINQLIDKMKQKPKLFDPEEIDGLAMGLEMIQKGNALFDELTDDEQAQIFKFVVEVERGALDDMFS